MLQDTVIQVLNESNKEVFKDETTISDLHHQNSQLLLQISKNNEDTSGLNKIAKYLKCVSNKLQQSINVTSPEKHQMEGNY